jgi:hypothetical protein
MLRISAPFLDVNNQGVGSLTSAYFDIDPNTGKPNTLSTPPYLINQNQSCLPRMIGIVI